MRFAIQLVGTFRTIETFDNRSEAIEFARNLTCDVMVFDYAAKMIVYRNW